MQRFEKSSQVRKYLSTKGVNPKLVKVRKSRNPFSGAASCVVEAKTSDGPIITESDKYGKRFYGREGSATVRLLVALRDALVGTNALVG